MENNRACAFDLQENLWELQCDNPGAKAMPVAAIACRGSVSGGGGSVASYMPILGYRQRCWLRSDECANSCAVRIHVRENVGEAPNGTL
jgi:hypothetical protein